MQEQSSSISSFKRFLYRLLLPLVAIVFAAGILFSWAFEHFVVFRNEGGGAYKINRILKETHADEIPIVGSSRAEGGLIPDSLGSNYFNYGLSGTKYDVTLFCLEQECRKTKTRPWILLNLDLDGLVYGLGDIASYIPNCGRPEVRQLLGSDYKPYFSIPFVKYYGRFETYFRTYLSERIELTKVSDRGARIEKNVLLPDAFAALVQEREQTPTAFTCDPTLKAKLFGLIKTHPGRRFIFVIAPYHKSFFDKFTNPADAAAFLDELRALPNAHVFDFSHMALPDSLFFNTSHVNFKGAVVFNHVLRDSLQAIGVH